MRNKGKKGISIFILGIMLMQLFSFSVSASPCCYVSVETITEEVGEVVFQLDYDSVFAPRDIGLSVLLDNGNYTYTHVTSTTVTVEDTNGSVNVSIDASYFLAGKTYRITPGWTRSCEWEACGEESTTFTPSTGLDIVDYDGRDLTLIGGGKMALRFQTEAAGYYDFSVQETEGYVHVKKYGRYGGTIEGIAYYEANEEIICIAENQNDFDAVFTINFAPAVISEEESLITGTPQDGDKLFSIRGNSGIRQIEIPVTGVYSMKRSAEQWYGYYKIMQGEEHICTIHEDTQRLIEAGTYYVDTTGAGAESEEGEAEDTLDIYYVVPEVLGFDQSYTVSNSADMMFYTFTLDAPAELSFVNEESNIYSEVCNFKYDIHRSLGQGDVYPAGEYFLSVSLYGDVQEGTFMLEKTPLESMEMNTALSPTYTDAGGGLHYAFQAPERAEYLFDFTQSASVGRAKDFYKFNSEYGDYVYITMEKDEWVNIGVEEGAILVVSKVGEPVYQPLALNVEAEYDYVCGKRNYYSYVAEKTDSYNLILNSFYDVKIYTADKILFEGDKNELKAFDLSEGETVYIQTIGRGIPSVPGTDTVKLVGSVLDIQSGDTFDLYDNIQTVACYTASETGLYEITVQKIGYSDYMYCTFNNSMQYIGRSNRTVKIVANLQAGEANTIRFSKCGSGNSCTATVTAALLETIEITADTSYDVSTGTYYKFKPETSGVYKVIGTIDGAVQPDVLQNVISSDKHPYFEYGDGNAVLGVAAGKEYTLHFNMDCNVVLEALEPEEVGLGQTCQTGDEIKAFSFSADADGYYRIANELSNTSLYILYDGAWTTVSGTYSNLFDLKQGMHFVVAAPDAFEDGSKPQGSFCAEKSESETELSVSIEDGFFLPSDGPALDFIVSGPEGKEVCFGFEYQDEDGTTQQYTCGYESMRCSDKRYRVSEYISCLELGKTYTLKPFIYHPNTEEEAMGIANTGASGGGGGSSLPEGTVLTYGEEKTVTIEMTDELITLTNKTTPVQFKATDAYHYFMKYYYFTFVQPEDGDVYFSFPDYVDYYSVYDENFEWVSSAYGTTDTYYILEKGKQYYIRAGTYGDGLGNVEVSSLPDGGTYDITEVNADAENGYISFSVSGGVVPGAAVYGALYDKDNRLIEISAVSEPVGAQRLDFAKLSEASRCKLMYLLTDAMHPLCEMEELVIAE